MAIITVSKTAGFCFGVSRAVQMVYEALDAGKAVLPQLVIDHLQRILAALTTGDLFKDHLHGGDTRSCTGHV